MKTELIYVLLGLASLLVLPNNLQAQKKGRLKGHFSALAVFQDAKPRKYRGYLLETRDSSLLFSSSRKIRLPYDPASMDELYVHQIERLKFGNNQAKNIAVGAGMLVGTVVGIALLPKESYMEEAGIMAIPMAITETVMKPVIVVSVMGVGAVIGAIVGKTFEEKYPIHGHQLNYERYRPEFEKYLVSPPE